MKVYPCGTDVVIEQSGIPGRITAVTERFGQVTYEVTYFVEYNCQKIALTERELMVKSRQRKKEIGFK